ncbi:MAG: putative branched-chain amino acid permease [Amycolatopsis sp.]|jgi:branched-subunit amino acid transport protein AzlD|uniref:branched-chain amino acid transporter permease n=1 Tax=Amycolatopsis sp. TaxID=37632 RepID=UPI0026016410|nr:AzlD domain-containing protein [Amycolatopsis sp.]MCU1684539.1 putative branched-chain amino acid permease [Amycolatopsis sp.]
MPSNGYVAAAVVLVASITFALRALPFALLGPLRSSRLAAFLARHMPAGIMVILVVYLLRPVTVFRAPYGIPEALGLTVTIGLHLWRRSGVLSILGGTACYVVLVNCVPAFSG